MKSPLCAAACAWLATAASLSAWQDDPPPDTTDEFGFEFEQPQEDPAVEFTLDFQDPVNMPGVMGRSNLLGQTSLFDNSFNPAIGFTIDALGEFSGVNGGVDRYNQVRARAVEMNVASRVDPLGWAYLTAAFIDNGAEREVELEEAALWLDDLPDTFSARGGRFLADFGKWNPLHTHDKPFPNEDLVRREFFGGPLFATGVEVHHWFGVGDVPVRWSLGAASEAEGDDHDFPEDEGGAPAFGRRGIDNWAATGRVTAQVDVGENGYFQGGVSGFYAPGMLEFAEIPAGTGTIVRADVRNAVVAADLTLRLVDATDLTADTASVEFWHQAGQVFDDTTGAILSDSNNGVWGFYEHAFSPFWSAGGTASWFEHRDSFNNTNFLSGGPAGSLQGVFLSHYLSEFNRVRVSVLHTNPGALIEDFWTLVVQWDMVLGSHTHPVDW